MGVILRARVELNRAFFTGELWINSCVRQLGSGKTLTSPPLVLFLTYPSVSSVLLTQNGGGGRGGGGNPVEKGIRDVQNAGAEGAWSGRNRENYATLPAIAQYFKI